QQGKPNSIFAYCQPYTDANGISWFGTNGYGVLKTDARKQLFTNYKTLTNNDAYNIRLNESFDTLPANLKKKYDFGFNSAVQDANGIYWMYAWVKEIGGLKLISYNPKLGVEKSWSLQGSNSEFARPLVYNDAKDRLWIFSNMSSGKEMIYQINKQTGKPVATYTISVDPIYNGGTFFMQLWQDAREVFWLAAANGLYRFNPSKNEWRHWQHKDDDSSSISADWIYSVCPDPAEPQHYLWLGTNGNGFDKFDMLKEKTVEHYSIADGLPNNVVYGILPDKAGNLWMSTNKGLSCFTPATKEFRNFSAEDGLLGDEFNHFDYMKLKNGDLLFGGVDGFTTFNPAAILQKQKQAPIVFTGLSISNKPVEWKKDSTIITSPIGYAQTITLHPGQNMFTISFASLEFRSNKKKFYKYKLDGFDEDWTTPTNKNEATYTNLSPGTYIFHVTGTNSDGVWNEKGISITVLVLPAWYQTYWFMAAVIILVAAGLYMLYRYRLQQVLKMVKLRNRIASDLHDEIGSTLSSISLYGAAAKKMVTGNEAANSILSKINVNTTAMMEAMSDIVWAINTRNDGLDNLANRMRNFAVQISEAKNIELHFTENEDLPAMPLDMVARKNMYLIFKEAVNNAVKYSGCKNLWISFLSEPNILKLTIKDDGKGFAKQEISAQVSGGNGMINMKNRAQEIRGELFIHSEDGKGTEVILKLHLKKS
ncbi:MAG TPA: triple tyrosine motif-containing protein, partial [Chitinophagaceae bacterium]|nr:triple tyrosine motif-containing protein [Chitinophagaceae bacterium]